METQVAATEGNQHSPKGLRQTLVDLLTRLLENAHAKNPNAPLFREYRRIVTRHLPILHRDLANSEMVSLLHAIIEPYEAKLFDGGIALIQELEPLLVYDLEALRMYLAQLPQNLVTHGSRFALLIAERDLTSDYDPVKAQNIVKAFAVQQRDLCLSLGESRPAPAIVPKEPHYHNPKWTESQRNTIRRMLQLEKIHFSKQHPPLAVRPRTFPLLVGATGVGKSSVVRHVVDLMGAHLIPASWSNWIPKGARDNQPTIESIVLACTLYEKVVLFVDELDKCPKDAQTDTWSRSLLGDIFAVLDGQVGWASLGMEAQRELKMPNGYGDPQVHLQDLVTCRLWIIGAGTWQRIFDDRERPCLGFNRSEDPEFSFEAKVRDSTEIPKELLARFNAQLLPLRYPKREELSELIENSGLKTLADSLGYHIDLDALDVRQNGLRCLETLATELLIRSHEAPVAAGASQTGSMVIDSELG